MTSKWEQVTLDERGGGHTYRLAVPGGWLYRTTSYRYPDLHRDWDALGPEEKQLAKEIVPEKAFMAIEVAAVTTEFVTGLDAALQRPAGPERSYMYGNFSDYEDIKALSYEDREMLDNTVGY